MCVYNNVYVCIWERNRVMRVQNGETYNSSYCTTDNTIEMLFDVCKVGIDFCVTFTKAFLRRSEGQMVSVRAQPTGLTFTNFQPPQQTTYTFVLHISIKLL